MDSFNLNCFNFSEIDLSHRFHGLLRILKGKQEPLWTVSYTESQVTQLSFPVPVWTKLIAGGIPCGADLIFYLHVKYLSFFIILS